LSGNHASLSVNSLLLFVVLTALAGRDCLAYETALFPYFPLACPPLLGGGGAEKNFYWGSNPL